MQKKFKTVKDLTRHVKRDVHHMDSFSCDLCTKTFKTKGNVAKHMQSVHEGSYENQMRNSRDKFEKKLKEYPNGKSK